MDSKEQRSALRAAVYRGDGRAVVDLLRGVGADDDSLQLAGDGVIAAVMQRVDGAAAGSGLPGWTTESQKRSTSCGCPTCAQAPAALSAATTPPRPASGFAPATKGLDDEPVARAARPDGTVGTR
jgi:hypothetical protein